MPITNPQQLREHIELAIQVELATIPPYLYAMWSIEDQGSEAALLIRSIVAEEMLHAALATNLLLAVGGTPDYASTRYMPRYPSELPHHRPPLLLELAPCSLDLIQKLFMRIEQPETHDAPAQPDMFETLGQFYHALENGLEAVAADFDIFSNPQTGLQLSNPEYYQPVAFDAEDSGGLIRIENLETAIATIEIIVHQGEGVSNERWADPDHQELTHYFKLLSIFDGSTPLGKVRNVARNPSRKDLPPLLHPVTDLFNALYRGLYLVMDRLFSPDVNQGRAVGVLYLLMADVLSQVGRFLVSQRLNDTEYAGPTFEVFDFGDDGPIAELTELSSRAAESFPELSTVHEALHGLSLIL